MERGSPEKQSQFQQLTPEKHNQFHCEIGQSPAANAGLRQRARTVSTAGGETMKRELARKKLARLREQESKVAIKEETEETPLLARTTIFEKMGARSPTHKPPSRQRTSSQRQHIFQVKTESVIERCVIRNVLQIMSCLQQLQLRSLLARTSTVVVQWEQLPAAAAAKRDNKIMDGHSALSAAHRHGNHYHQKSKLCYPFQSQ